MGLHPVKSLWYSHSKHVCEYRFCSNEFTVQPFLWRAQAGNHLKEMKASLANPIALLSSSLFLLRVVTAAKGGPLVLISVWAAEPA